MRCKIMIVFSLLVGIAGARSEETAKRLYNQTVKVSYMDRYCTKLETSYYPIDAIDGFYMAPNVDKELQSAPDYLLTYLKGDYADSFGDMCGFDEKPSNRRHFQVSLTGSKNWEISVVDRDTIDVHYETYKNDRRTELWEYPMPDDTYMRRPRFSGKDMLSYIPIRIRYVGPNKDDNTSKSYLQMCGLNSMTCVDCYRDPYYDRPWGSFIPFPYCAENLFKSEAIELTPAVGDTIVVVHISRLDVESKVENRGDKASDELIYLPLFITGEEGMLAVKLRPRKNLIKIPRRTMVDVKKEDLKDFTLKIPVEIREPLKYGCRLKSYRPSTTYEELKENNPDSLKETLLPLKINRILEKIEWPEVYIPAGATRIDLPVRITCSAPDALFTGETKYGLIFQLRINRRIKTDKPVFDDGTPQEYADSISDVLNGQEDGANHILGINVIEPNRLNFKPEKVSFPDLEQSEGSLEGLFDDNDYTYCHSSWTKAIERSEPYGSYMDIELENPIQSLYFSMHLRKNAVSTTYPKQMAIYTSNDGKTWTLLAKPTSEDITDKNATIWCGSAQEPFKSTEPFKYIRWCVLTNSYDKKLTATDKSAYWHLSELHFFGK